MIQFNMIGISEVQTPAGERAVLIRIKPYPQTDPFPGFYSCGINEHFWVVKIKIAYPETGTGQQGGR
jgi:hypothetical protein